MKDFEGNELVEGWYWYSSNDESDVFYPVYVDPNGVAIVNGKRRPLIDFANLNLFKAEMPS